MSCSIIICPLLLIIAIAVIITSIATPHWLDIDVNLGTSAADVSAGLFKICTMGTCVVYDDHSMIKVLAGLHMVRALVIIAAILYGVGFLIMAHFGLKHQTIRSKNHSKACLAVCILGGVLACAGAVHYVRMQEAETVGPGLSYDYGYSLHLAWVSGVFAIIAGLVSIPVVNAAFNNSGTAGTGGNVNNTGQPPQYWQGASQPQQQNMAYPNQQVAMNANNQSTMYNPNMGGNPQYGMGHPAAVMDTKPAYPGA